MSAPKSKPRRKAPKKKAAAPKTHQQKPTWLDFAASAPGLCFGILYSMLTIMLVWLAR